MALVVKGGNRVLGTVTVQGSKNAVLPIMVAALLAEGKTTITHCPDIWDVRAMMEVLENLGIKVSLTEGNLCLDSTSRKSTRICQKKVQDIRASVLLMGYSLACYQRVTIAYPGGCSIGERPIDFHLAAFRSMGAIIIEQEEELVCYCPDGLHGAHVILPFPSVGATENIILAAVLAEGETVIENAAREPEIIELIAFMRCMGADIHGEGTSCIKIVGKKRLQAITWQLSQDRIAFLTYAMLLAGCGGEADFYISPRYLKKEILVLEKLGCECAIQDNRIHICRRKGIAPISYLKTGPYPEYPTDGQSLLLAVVTKAHGVSTIEETVFENRFRVVRQLRKMGANIDSVSNRARIVGVTKLHGAIVQAPDLRSGAGLLIAAAMADGKSCIENEHYIERGYERIEETMHALNIDVRRE